MSKQLLNIKQVFLERLKSLFSKFSIKKTIGDGSYKVLNVDLEPQNTSILDININELDETEPQKVSIDIEDLIKEEIPIFDIDEKDVTCFIDSDGAKHTCPLVQKEVRYGNEVIICKKCDTYHLKRAVDSMNIDKCQSCGKSISRIKPITLN